MAHNREVETTFSYLTSLSLRVSREWLTGCVEYFKAENSQYTTRDIQEFVKQQWELSDLRDSSDGCLPPNLHSQMKITLTGKYSLQIESVLNINESAYSQLQKIKKVDVTNVEATEMKEETHIGRMLKLMLCDGRQEVQAIEYRPLPALNEFILPGTKILIIGPVDCRRGVFFLKPQNIKVLGGEVDSLLKTNHYENILTRSLSLPENPDPFSSGISTTVSSSLTTTQGNVNTPSVTPNTVYNNPTRNPRQTATSFATRTSEQLFTSTTVRSTSQLQTASAVDNLEGTGWTVDDLLAEGDDIFLDVPEEISLAADEPASTSVARGITENTVPVTNSTVEKQGNNYFHPPCKPVPKTSWISIPDKPTSKPSQSTKKSNPFLASDDYLNSIDMDEWENDLDDSFNIPSISKRDTKQHTKSSTENISLHQTFKHSLCEPQNHGYSYQSSVLKTVPDNVTSKELISSVKSSPISQHPTSMKPLSPSLATIQMASTSVNSPHLKTPPILQNSTHLNSPSLGTSKISSTSVKPSSIQHPSPMKPLSTALDITKVPVVSPSVFGDTKAPSKPMNSPSALHSTQHLSTSRFGNKSVSKSPSPYYTSSTTMQAKEKSDVVSADRYSFLESRSHLCPSISSPSDWSGEPSCKKTSNDADDSKTTTSSVSVTWPLDCHTALPSKSSIPHAVAISTLKSKVPFVYLGHILQSEASKPSGTHRVKATIMSLLSHLKVDSSGEWNLSAKICDGTATLDVKFAPEVLDDLIGLSAHEFKKMKRDLPRNPLLKNHLVKLLKNSQQKLIDLNCFFDIKFGTEKIAEVIKVSEITKQDVQDLRSRMKDL